MSSSAVGTTATSIRPLRRCSSLVSCDRQSAQSYWADTLRKQLGTPGPSPDPREVPGLRVYRSSDIGSENRGTRGGRAQSQGACTRMSLSTLGPSASVVAWMVQFRCENCNRIPQILDARYCAHCGCELPRPEEALSSVVRQEPPAPAPTGGTRAKAVDGTPTKAKAVEGCPPIGPQQSAGRARSSSEAKLQSKLASSGEKLLQPVQSKGEKLLQPLVEAHGARKPSGPLGLAKMRPLKWVTRESQLAQWMGVVRPRYGKSG